ncbi:MAG: hypothetical protein AAGG07_05950 [Planctomycetota bacterium]
MSTGPIDRLIDQSLRIGVIALIAGLGWLGYAVLSPLSLPRADMSTDAQTPVPSLTYDGPSPSEITRLVAGSTLIKPSRVQPAVLDTGAAAKLAESLRLQSVVELGDGLSAYVRVRDDGIARVRAGDTLNGLLVESIEGNRMVLSLEGVFVELGF